MKKFSFLLISFCILGYGSTLSAMGDHSLSIYENFVNGKQTNIPETPPLPNRTEQKQQWESDPDTSTQSSNNPVTFVWKGQKIEDQTPANRIFKIPYNETQKEYDLGTLYDSLKEFNPSVNSAKSQGEDFKNEPEPISSKQGWMARHPKKTLLGFGLLSIVAWEFLDGKALMHTASEKFTDWAQSNISSGWFSQKN